MALRNSDLARFAASAASLARTSAPSIGKEAVRQIQKLAQCVVGNDHAQIAIHDRNPAREIVKDGLQQEALIFGDKNAHGLACRLLGQDSVADRSELAFEIGAQPRPDTDILSLSEPLQPVPNPDRA